MMKIAGKVFYWMKKTLRQAVIGTTLGLAYSQAAMAGDMPSNMDFRYMNGQQQTEAYKDARNYLDARIFKGTPFSKAAQTAGGGDFPQLGLAEYDLNKDGKKEILVFPVEVTDGNLFCSADETCPYYVLQRTKQGFQNLGIIQTYILNHGKDVRNGYTTLEAHTKIKDPDYFELYVYDPARRQYVPEAQLDRPAPIPSQNKDIPNTLGFWRASSVQDHPGYTIARDVLDGKLYAQTVYAKTRKNGPAPTFQIADFDLNGDQTPETIVAPFYDSRDEDNSFCKTGGLCPYYILQTEGKTTRVLGKIDANILSRGNDITNGYWTLKAYTKAGDSLKDATYYYDKAKRSYTLSPNAAPPPPQ